MLMPMYPTLAENVAPITKASILPTLIIIFSPARKALKNSAMATTTLTKNTVLNCFFRYASAPLCIARETFCISSVPLSLFITNFIR